MNKAQKRIWAKVVVSILGLIFMSGALTITKVYALEVSDTQDRMAVRMLGLLNTIPLILIVILDWRRKKICDERDIYIEHRASVFGIVGAFAFLAAAGLFLTIKTKLGSFRADLILSLVFLSFFIWILVSSAAALVQYPWGGKENE